MKLQEALDRLNKEGWDPPNGHTSEWYLTMTHDSGHGDLKITREMASSDQWAVGIVDHDELFAQKVKRLHRHLSGKRDTLGQH